MADNFPLITLFGGGGRASLAIETAIRYYDPQVWHGGFLMAQTLSVTEAARHFAEYVNRVVYRGESFVLVRGNKPIAELRPLPAGRRLAELPALLASLPHLSATDAAQLADDLTAAREALARAEVRDPWRS
jgi:antitoxin (DNA-binding transcriptional repressor) of toxin-antitoxin stability system